MFARDLSHDLHETPGNGAGNFFRQRKAKRRDVTRTEGGLVPKGVSVPRRFLFDDGANERVIEREPGGGGSRQFDELVRRVWHAVCVSGPFVKAAMTDNDLARDENQKVKFPESPITLAQLRSARPAVEFHPANGRSRSMAVDSLLFADFFEKLVDMGKMVGGHILDERACDFFVTDMAIKPPQEECELDGRCESSRPPARIEKCVHFSDRVPLNREWRL